MEIDKFKQFQEVRRAINELLQIMETELEEEIPEEEKKEPPRPPKPPGDT